MHVNATLFSCSQYNTSYFPCFMKPPSKISSGCSTWALQHHLKSSWSVEKVCEKMKPISFALCWPCDSQARSRTVKVVEVSGAYKHGWYEKIWLKSVRVMSILATQTIGQPDNMTHYIDPYVTHMDQKGPYTPFACLSLKQNHFDLVDCRPILLLSSTGRILTIFIFVFLFRVNTVIIKDTR